MAATINEEPVQERDLAMMGILSSIGIEKGKPFNPDARTQEILELAIKDAYDYMQDLFVNKAFKNYIEGTQWSTFNLSMEQAKAGFPFVTKDRSRIGFLRGKPSGCAFDSTGQKIRCSISPGNSRISRKSNRTHREGGQKDGE